MLRGRARRRELDFDALNEPFDVAGKIAVRPDGPRVPIHERPKRFGQVLFLGQRGPLDENRNDRDGALQRRLDLDPEVIARAIESPLATRHRVAPVLADDDQEYVAAPDADSVE